jgi:hypothetical protein
MTSTARYQTRAARDEHNESEKRMLAKPLHWCHPAGMGWGLCLKACLLCLLRVAASLPDRGGRNEIRKIEEWLQVYTEYET